MTEEVLNQPNPKKKIPKWVKITAIVVVVVLAVAGTLIGIFLGKFLRGDVDFDPACYTAFSYQDAPDATWLSTQTLKYSEADMLAKIAPVAQKFETNGALKEGQTVTKEDLEAVVEYMVYAQINTYDYADSNLSFIGTDTDIDMIEEAKSTPFTMLQHSAYAEVFSANGDYYKQMSSTLLTIEADMSSIILGIVKGLAQSADRALTIKSTGMRYETPAGSALSPNNSVTDFMNANKDIVGANVAWGDSKKIEPTPSNATPLPKFEGIEAASDDQLTPDGEGGYKIKEKQDDTGAMSTKWYYFQADEDFSWRKAYDAFKDDKGVIPENETNKRVDGAENMMWDEVTQAYQGFVRDYNTGDNDLRDGPNWVGNMAANTGRVFPRVYRTLTDENGNIVENTIMLSNHLLKGEYIDPATLVLKEENDGASYTIQFSILEGFVETVGRYSKGSLVDAINGFVYPSEIVYTAMTFDIGIWNVGLVKRFDRKEYWKGNGNLQATSMGLIKKITGKALNACYHPFGYGPADTVATNWWQDYASVD